MTFTRLLAIAIAALIFVLPQAASADDMIGSKHAFDHNKVVGDDELATMRGGFIDANGLLLDISFLQRIQIGIQDPTIMSLISADLAQAALTASSVQDLLQPNIIQNIDDNTLISIQQALNVTVINPEVLNQLSQMNQLQFQQGL